MMKKTVAVLMSIIFLIGMTNLNALDEPVHLIGKKDFSYLNVIDDIKFSNTELWHGEKMRIDVSFSEKENFKITENSIITLDIPEGLKAFKIFKEDSIDLSFQGINYGKVYTNDTSTQIIVEFNENTNDRYEIKEVSTLK